ncbi:hypothetical protein [Burkholderia metallica]|uniref:hypothetical protein n=1 Tax=Burkholderia metallica TaxID=488729 RepID=UPI0015883278|nr:hypothetical protein [Burkholderia metallica]
MRELEQAREAVSQAESKLNQLKDQLARMPAEPKTDWGKFEQFRLRETIEFMEGLVEYYTLIRDDLEEGLI